jgi:hypothetical protein
MKKFIAIIFLSCSPAAIAALNTWDRLHSLILDDLDKAELWLDKIPQLSPEQKDQLWLWMRSGCRETLNQYSQIERKHGAPSADNAIDIIADQIDTKSRWTRIFSKAVARGIRPVLDSDLYDTYQQQSAYQDEVREKAQTNLNVDPENE